MARIVRPKETDLRDLVAPYLKAQPTGLGLAIGYASPRFSGLYFAGNVQNQLGSDLLLGKDTPFEIASITKTFTSTLYALAIGAICPNRTVGDFLQPNETLNKITLDALMNYTSGLPSDNVDDPTPVPPFWPRPYSMQSMLSFLEVYPPSVSPSEQEYSYSNLAFSIMAAVLGSSRKNGQASDVAFIRNIRKHVFQPLRLRARFFDEISLVDLPLGFHYKYLPSPTYIATQPGHVFFPAYFGASGIVATPRDMLKWLRFNMSIFLDPHLTPTLSMLQSQATKITEPNYGHHLGLGWFIKPPVRKSGDPGLIFKDGEHEGFSSYVGFLPSADPGSSPSDAGAFVLVNADGIRDGKVEMPAAVTNDLPRLMQDKKPLADKAAYPRVMRSRVLQRLPKR
jgi:D-alanyl-D-alanine-carboxypeptidase/D-alanyl-D-alanine-endopeptidase